MRAKGSIYMKNQVILAIVCLYALCGSSSAQANITRTSTDDVFTLYRNSAVLNGQTWRLHVATFDANDGKDYNQENCDVARELFQKQQNVTVHYWCEKGYFRK